MPGTCIPDPSQFLQKCPFPASSVVCENWYLCDTASPFYNGTGCLPDLETACCPISNLNYPSACQGISGLNCTASCADEQSWTACPSILSGLWTSLPLVGSLTISPVWSMALSGSIGMLVRKYPAGVTPDPSTIGYSFNFTARCRGNFDASYDIDLVFSNQYQGFIARGTVLPPSVQDPSQGYILSNQTATNVLLMSLTECATRPEVSPLSNGFTLGQIINVIAVGGGGNCSNPMTVSLPSSSSGPTTRAFTFSPLFTIASCAASVSFQYSYRWTVTGGSTSLTSKAANLIIAAGTLAPGTYEVDLAVTVTGLPILRASSQLVVLALPPVTVIVPYATVLEVGVDQTFVLDGSGSYDPNMVTGQPPSPVACLWTCLYLDGSSPCVVPDPTSCVMTMPNDTLIPNESMEFILELTSTATSITSSSSVLVNTLPFVLATISLSVVGMTSTGYVDGTKAVRIIATVQATDPGDVLSYQWTSVASITTQSISLISSNLLSATTTYNLVIAPNVLQIGSPYLFQLTVSSGSLSVRASIQVGVYPPPAGGLLDVQPTSGYFASTIFALNAELWVDPTGSTSSYLLYNFAVQQPGYPLYFLKQNPDDNSYLATQNLPLGNFTVYAYVYSPYGYTVSNGVQVSIIQNQTTSALDSVNQLSQNLNQSLTRQDPNAVVQTVVLMSQMLNALTNSTKRSSVDPAQLTTIRAQLVIAIQIASNLTVLTEYGVSQLVPLLNSVTSVASQLDADTQALVFQLAEAFAQLSYNAPNDFVQVLSSLLDALQLSLLGSSTPTELGVEVDQLVATLTSFFTAYLSQSICDENPVTATSSNFNLEGHFKSNFAGFDQGNFSFGDAFNPFSDPQNCHQLHFTQNTGNPYSWQQNTSYQAICNVQAIDFFYANGSALSLSGLPSEAAVIIDFPCFTQTNQSFDNVSCIFWDVVAQDWSDVGCTKQYDTSSELFYCNCSHLTSFSIGPFTISANVINPSDSGLLDELLETEGGIISLTLVIGFFVIYIVAFTVAIFYDRKSRGLEKAPSAEQFRNFVDRYFKMYGRRVDVTVFETLHLEEWEKVYEISRADDEKYKPKFWDLLRVHVKDGFRQQHLYLSMFFVPLQGYTRPQRITIIFTILYTSLVTNAFMFQYNDEQQVSVGSRAFASIISSLIVFVPTTLLGYLFRRCDRRVNQPKHVSNYTLKDYEELGVDVSKLQQGNKFMLTLFDWHMPWWCACVLYGITYLAWFFSVYCTLLYGVTFRDEKAVAFFEAFLISLAMSVLVLQTAKALVGGVFVTITSGVVATIVLAAVGTGNLFAMQ